MTVWCELEPPCSLRARAESDELKMLTIGWRRTRSLRPRIYDISTLEPPQQRLEMMYPAVSDFVVTVKMLEDLSADGTAPYTQKATKI